MSQSKLQQGRGECENTINHALRNRAPDNRQTITKAISDQCDLIELISMIYDEPRMAAIVDIVIEEVFEAEAAAAAAAAAEEARKKATEAAQASPAPASAAQEPAHAAPKGRATSATRESNNGGHFFVMEPCPHEPGTLRMFVDRNASGTLEQDRWQKNMGRTVWADLLRQPGKMEPGPFNVSDWQVWMMEVVSKCSPLMPERLMKTFLWEAVKIPFEDCDTVPSILRGFDQALKKHLIDNSDPVMKGALESMTLKGQMNSSLADITGKQVLNYIVGGFARSRSSMIQEAYDSLSNFRVSDPNDPISWEEAFNTYEIKVFIASVSGAQSTEKEIEVLIAGLESYLLRSGDIDLKHIQRTLEIKARGNKNFLPSQQLKNCPLYTSDAADDLHCVDLGGRRIIHKNNTCSCELYMNHKTITK